jgi:GGDEF domain-containing protein
VLFRVSTIDAVMAVANQRWWHELVARDRARAGQAGVPLSVAMFRVLGIAELDAARGSVATHRLLRAIAQRVRAQLGDRPVGRVDGSTLAVLLEGNLDARYPFVDALRRAIVDTAGLDVVAAIADLPHAHALTDLEARAFARLEGAASAGTRGLVVVD